MKAPDYLDLLAERVVCCTKVNNAAERVCLERGVLEAIGHVLDPGVLSDATAMRQGLDYFCIEIGGALPRRMRHLFVAGFVGVVSGFRAHTSLRRLDV
ncbi:hypothetical protein PQR64_24030 [Paraburkholderia phytofirmans]|uniref:hypothetical protein n=1 Tax=Paraburkholderia phytofirmans TaxID=261302 RepID=UPI0038B6BF8A